LGSERRASNIKQGSKFVFSKSLLYFTLRCGWRCGVWGSLIVTLKISPWAPVIKEARPLPISESALSSRCQVHANHLSRGALRGIPGNAYLQPEPNAIEQLSNAIGRPELKMLQATAPSPTPTRAEEHLATSPGWATG